MRFAIFALIAIFFTACATQSTQSTQNLSNTPNPLNTRDSMRGIELNSTFGLGLYGFMYMLQNACGDADYKACENLLQSACDEGDFKYCTLLGTMYLDGLNKPPNDEVQKAKVTALFKKACDGKNGSGCLMLGKIDYGERINDFTTETSTMPYARLACEYEDLEGCINIALENEKIFKALKLALEHDRARDEAESKEFYATAKDAAKSALLGYERLVALLQKECENAKKRIEVAKETHKTLGAKLLDEYKAGHIDFDTLTERTDKLQEQTYYEEFFESRYCKMYTKAKDGREKFEKGFEGF